MNLKEKLAQLIVCGFRGPTPPQSLTRLIQARGLGGVILFRDNLKDPAQIASLTSRLQELSPSHPLLIMVDQEGGRISRLPPPFTRFPSGAVLGACNSTTLAYQMGQALARELRSVGINMNLAPVLDVLTNPKNSVIGDRALGSDPLQVSKIGLALAMGLQDARVVACGKHFPGHGDTASDSHKELPVMAHSQERLTRVEYPPFEHAIQNRLQALMTAHVVYKALDSRYPATLSQKILTGILREEMGFSGVVLSDDFRMQAITDHYSVQDAAVRAINAGVDLLLVGVSADHASDCLKSLEQAVRRGPLDEKRIDQSVQRILNLKGEMLLPVETVPAGDLPLAGFPDHRELVKEIRARSGHASVRAG